MRDEKDDNEQDQALRERFGNMEKAFKERFEMTKPGTEPIKDEDKKRKS